MAESSNAQNNLERWTSRTLRVGVWGSACLMIAGLLVAQLLQTDPEPFQNNPTLRSLFLDLFSRSAYGSTLMYLGIVFLMITPFLRVLTAIFGFAVEKDRRFVIVSLVVFAMLIGELVYSLN